MMTLMVSPVARGCGLAADPGCSMSDCPLSEAMVSADCHLNDTLPGPDLKRDRDDDCCGVAPLTPGSNRVDAVGFPERLDNPGLDVAAAKLRVRSSREAPSLAFEAVMTRQHDLGRFTLNSSFLL
jgi:hypothetical protein